LKIRIKVFHNHPEVEDHFPCEMFDNEPENGCVYKCSKCGTEILVLLEKEVIDG